MVDCVQQMQEDASTRASAADASGKRALGAGEASGQSRTLMSVQKVGFHELIVLDVPDSKISY